MKRQNIVNRNDRVEGPFIVKDKMKNGRKENKESVFGFAYAWQHYKR